MGRFFIVAVVVALLVGISCDAQVRTAEWSHPLAGASEATLAAAFAGATPAVVVAGGKLTTVRCERGLASPLWREVRRGPLRVRVVANTAAEYDIEQIVSARLIAYDRIQDALGIVERPEVTLVFSPDRNTAAGNGLGAGMVHDDVIEALWLPSPTSFEQRRPGYLLALWRAGRTPDGEVALPMVVEGIAQWLDGSGRDLHRAFVEASLAAPDAGVLTRFQTANLDWINRARAASWVALLADEFGVEGLREIWRRSGGRAPATGSELEKVLNELLETSVGVGLEEVRERWAVALRRALPDHTGLSDADRSEIRAVLRHADLAVTRGDVESFRATLDGFYCDGSQDDYKEQLAERAVAHFAAVDTSRISLLSVGLRNYPEVLVHGVRRERRNGAVHYRPVQIWFEQFPEGWRITNSAPW